MEYFLSRLEKFLERILRNPIPNDITFDEMSRFLLSIGCTIRKKAKTRHRQFKFPGYEPIITLMAAENVRGYQVSQIKGLLDFIDLIEEG